jgi:transcriptional regulator with XRE-family HTH domain
MNAHTRNRWFTVVDGTRVRYLRRQHGLSPAELAGQAGIGLSTMLRIERQPGRLCRTRTLVRLATALGQPPATLIPAQPSPVDAPG